MCSDVCDCGGEREREREGDGLCGVCSGEDERERERPRAGGLCERPRAGGLRPNSGGGEAAGSPRGSMLMLDRLFCGVSCTNPGLALGDRAWQPPTQSRRQSAARLGGGRRAAGAAQPAGRPGAEPRRAMVGSTAGRSMAWRDARGCAGRPRRRVSSRTPRAGPSIGSRAHWRWGIGGQTRWRQGNFGRTCAATDCAHSGRGAASGAGCVRPASWLRLAGGRAAEAFEFNLQLQLQMCSKCR